MEISKNDATGFINEIHKNAESEDKLEHLSDDELAFIQTAVKAAKKETLMLVSGESVDGVQTDVEAKAAMEIICKKLSKPPQKISGPMQVWNHIKKLFGVRADSTCLIRDISRISDPRKMLRQLSGQRQRFDR